MIPRAAFPLCIAAASVAVAQDMPGPDMPGPDMNAAWAGKSAVCAVIDRCIADMARERPFPRCDLPAADEADAALHLRFDAACETVSIRVPGGDRFAPTPGAPAIEGPAAASALPVVPGLEAMTDAVRDLAPLTLHLAMEAGQDGAQAEATISPDAVLATLRRATGIVTYIARCEGAT